MSPHVCDCENGCTMDDLAVQYGKSEALYILALKELSEKYEPKNHDENLVLDDQDDVYTEVDKLLADFEAEETQIRAFINAM